MPQNEFSNSVLSLNVSLVNFVLKLKFIKKLNRIFGKTQCSDTILLFLQGGYDVSFPSSYK